MSIFLHHDRTYIQILLLQILIILFLFLLRSTNFNNILITHFLIMQEFKHARNHFRILFLRWRSCLLIGSLCIGAYPPLDPLWMVFLFKECLLRNDHGIGLSWLYRKMIRKNNRSFPRPFSNIHFNNLHISYLFWKHPRLYVLFYRITSIFLSNLQNWKFL